MHHHANSPESSLLPHPTPAQLEYQIGLAFDKAIGRRDWAAAHSQITAARDAGLAQADWALRECDWLMAQRRWGEAGWQLRTLLAVPGQAPAFELSVRYNLASIDLVH